MATNLITILLPVRSFSQHYHNYDKVGSCHNMMMMMMMMMMIIIIITIIIIMTIQHRLIPGNQSSSQISMQDFRLPTPFLGYAPIQGEQMFALFFRCLGFPVSSSSPSISVTWNPKPQPPLAHCVSFQIVYSKGL